MDGSFKIGSIIGIPIKVHITFLLILPIFAAIFASNPTLFGDVEPFWLSLFLGVILAVIFFFCVLLHELGHSFVALKNGVNIDNITLIIFGGVSQMEEVPKDPSVELIMALAGPSVSVVLGAFFLSINFLLGFGVFSLIENGNIPILFRVIGWLGIINIALTIFNMLPAFPMDGGRVLRAVLAKKLPYLEATSKAASIGKAFAFLLGLLGLFQLEAGGVWLILIAFFIYIGASREEKGTRVSITLEDFTVEDIMTQEVETLKRDMYLDEVIDIMLEKKHTGYPVVSDGELKGIITLGDIHEVAKEKRESTLVEDVMSTDLLTVSPSTPAYEGLKIMSLNDIGRLPVIDEGKLVGIISRTDLTTAMEILSE